jgi:[histone H3]-lysine4 N-trimethyltransferase SETD1
MSFFSAFSKHCKSRCRPAPYRSKEPTWDPKTSIGRGPPTKVVVHGYDPLTVTEVKIRAMLSQFGDVSEVKNLTDPRTGSFLGVCSVCFRDKTSRDGTAVKAIDAARNAEKQGSGQRIDQWTVKIERDPEGLRSRRYAENITNKRRAAFEKELESERKATPKPGVSPIVIPPATSGASAAPVPTPPPNAPKGPSGKPPPQGPRTLFTRPSAHSLVEDDSILPKIKRKPYIFIGHCYVPVLGTTIKHLQNRMKMYDWREIRCDRTGYFITFDDSRRGEDEAQRCFRECHLQPLFTYTMNMECQQYGNPNYERSPTPERVAAELAVKEEQLVIKKEDEKDFEMEKRERVENLDPAKAMLELLIPTLRHQIIDDIKKKLSGPAIWEFLDPDNLVEKRAQHNIPAPIKIDVKHPIAFARADYSPSIGTPDSRSGFAGGYKRSLTQTHRNRSRQETRPLNLYSDGRRRRVASRVVGQLHRRLQEYDSGDDSDDERRTSVTRGSDGIDSRAISEAAKSPARFDVDEDGHLTPHTKRRRAGWAGESDDESVDAGARKSLGALLDKEIEDMSIDELEKVLSTQSKASKLYKHAFTEVKLRKQKAEDDALFFPDGKQQDGQIVSSIDIKIEDTDSVVAATPEPVEMTKGKKKAPAKTKRKTKKQLQEEQDALERAAEAAHLDKVIAEAEHTPALETAEEDPMPEERPEVEWGVSTTLPRRTVEDDNSIVHDLDGWQYIIKGEQNDTISEDIKFLKIALQSIMSIDLGTDPDYWAWKEKQFKALNSSEDPGISREPIQISGYYIPNTSGCARTEPYQKIKESEKSKYLPHRIKVKNLREQRQAEAKKNPSALPEATAKALNAVRSSNVTSRTNRAEIRRQQNVIHTTKLSNEIDSDAVRFNQLKKRKKNVRFDRSSIHGWGLYAEEKIVVGDMIIEYVGEKVRTRVAECREVMYIKQGIGSSYLFRIDDDMVIDATKKGGIARFINHSCMPNCTAKIIKVEGTKRIVIYALRDIEQGIFSLIYISRSTC